MAPANKDYYGGYCAYVTYGNARVRGCRALSGFYRGVLTSSVGEVARAPIRESICAHVIDFSSSVSTTRRCLMHAADAMDARLKYMRRCGICGCWMCVYRDKRKCERCVFVWVCGENVWCEASNICFVSFSAAPVFGRRERERELSNFSERENRERRICSRVKRERIISVSIKMFALCCMLFKKYLKLFRYFYL